MHLFVQRTKAQEIGYTAHDIAQNLLVSLSGSFQTSPTFWVDPKNRVSYQIATQTPQYRTDTLQDLENIPVTGPGPDTPSSILANVASVQRGTGVAVGLHYDIQPVLDIFGAIQGRDLGGVSRDINRIIEKTKAQLPRGSQVVMRGQVQTMNASFIGLLEGLAFSIVLVYLLIVVNFQSWLDPFIIITALPAALTGIVWCLFATHTTISVPALTGTIMCMGVATSNSILVVQFATEKMGEGKDPLSAALGGWIYALPPRAHDGPGHDHWHGADVSGPGRRRRTKRPAGPRRDRRAALRHGLDAAFRSNCFQHSSRPPSCVLRRPAPLRRAFD